MITLSHQLDQAERMELSGTDLDASGYELSTGHLTLHFSEGRMAKVRDGHGPVGLVLAGRGEGQYRHEGSRNRNALAFTIEELTRLKLRGDTVSFRLNRALIVWPGGLPEQGVPEAGEVRDKDSLAREPGGGRAHPAHQSGANALHARGPGPDAPGDGTSKDESSPAREQLSRVLTETLAEDHKLDGWDLPLRRLAALSGAGPSPVFLDMDGKARLQYLRDPADGSEKLMIVTRLDGGGSGGGTFRSAVADAVPVRASVGAPAWRLTRASLDISVEKPPALELKARLTLIPSLARDIAQLHLDEGREVHALQLVDPARQFEARPVVRVGPPAIRVRSVTDAAGIPLDFVHRYGMLVVRLSRSATAGEPLDLDVDLDTDLARPPAGHDYFALREPGWFPIPDGQRGRFELSWRVRTREPLRPIVAGDIGEKNESDSAFSVASHFPIPIRNPVLVCGKFVATHAPQAQVPVTAWTYARPSAQALPIARFCSAALAFFSERFGRYPFGRLDVVEAARATGGQSGPGILLVEGMDPQDLARYRRLQGAAGFNMTFAHEVAHQWWGQKVSWKDPSDESLFEALAEYSGWLFVRSLKGTFGEQPPQAWLGMARSSAAIASIGEADLLLADEIARQHRANLVYGKGALMLQALAAEVGEGKFLEGLGAFAREFDGREANGEDLLAVLRRVAGRDLQASFDRWFHETGMPSQPSREMTTSP